MIPREAIILVGGLGTRLRPVVRDLPKPLAPVAGRPFLAWLLDRLAAAGLTRVVLATGQLGHLVEAAIGPRHGGLEVLYAPEEQPLGTGGALLAALPRTTGERVFALNGDTWLEADLGALAAHAPAADLVFAARPVADRSRYGSVALEGGRMVGLHGKGETGPGLINAGLYLLRRGLLGGLRTARSLPPAFSFEREVLERPGSLDIRAVPVDGRFIDIGTPEDFAAAQTLLPAWCGSSGGSQPHAPEAPCCP